jgi:hypothetical protein
MSKELFTFIMEWNGGTYVSQVEANHIEHAINEWLINLDLEMLSWKQSDIDIINEERGGDFPLSYPVALDGLFNVWCFSPNIKDILAIVNIVKTVRKGN